MKNHKKAIHSKTWKRCGAAVLTGVLAVSGISWPAEEVNAQYVSGTAPFINSWLVSGPYDTAVADEIYGTVIPENPNLAQNATASASSETLAPNPAEYLIDGSTRNQWVTEGEEVPCWVQLDWEKPVDIGTLSIAQWGDSRHENQWYDLTFTFADGSEMADVHVDAAGTTSSNPAVYTPETTLEDVTSVKVVIDEGRENYPSITGISEIEVYQYTDEAGDGETNGAEITPVLGGTMVEGGLEWEYFDDRIWNRTYDDYQDLYGYYGVKKGVDTKNKYVYAHTYIYSPAEQQVQFRFGTSGENRLYVNDHPVTNVSTPAEVQKDMITADVVLKEGWNKVLLQIKHTYTDDKNSNGVPIAQDSDVYYFGFYGRVTDESGNEVEGLSYSVTGTDEELTVTTGGLSAKDVVDDGKAGRGLPENELPSGYTEWPYVWNESQYKDSTHNLSASAFQFMADGGKPGYTWTLAEGELPGGLTLNEDGTIDGIVDCDPGDYTFTVQVEDQDGNTAQKEFTLTIKERPNKWFEEGRVSALSHTGPVYQYFVDPNFSADLWAERASRQGHSMVSVEALQQNYYWPSRFADPDHERQKYLPKDENGQVVDGLKQFEEAVKRYGMKFGLYYATEGGGLQHYSTDVFVQNVEDLILRYDPAYLYFDGPQAMPNANYDVMYSMVRNYSDEIIIDANVWGSEYGDPDIRTGECSGIYERATGSNLTKRTVMEPWKSLHTKNNYTPYYARRDDYRIVAQEMIANAGRGMVDNNDQMPIMSRGTNWDSPEDVATRYPISLQEFIDVREGMAAWFAPEGKTERHESTTGTMPYFLNGSSCSCEDDGKDNIDHFEAGHGPAWGYSTYRDNNIYLHIMEGPDGRTGFDAITDNTLSVDPITDRVEKVIWLNEDKDLQFSQEGDTLTIDLSGVEEDQVDTIIKIVTDNPEREYTLTNMTAEGEQVAPDQLQIKAEGYMTYQALKADLESISYVSEDPSVAAVDENGLVTPVGEGTTEITVSGTYEGVTQETTLKVTSRDGMVYCGEEMISASLWVNGWESYGVIGSSEEAEITLEGRSEKGGAIGLDGADVTLKCGIVDLDGGDEYTPVKIDESDDIVTFTENGLIAGNVSEQTRAAVWAEVELDGQTFTTNRVYLDITPYSSVTEGAEVTAEGTLDGTDAANVTDGKTIEGTDFDSSRWSAAGDGESSLTFKLNGVNLVENIEVNFNSDFQKYYNTPKTMEIQVSDDGTQWKTVSEVTPPSTSTDAYFGYSDIYEIDPVETQYVRLYFPEGSNGSRLDIMEVAINGENLSSQLARIEAVPELTSDTTAEVAVTGYNGLGSEMNLSEAQIEITSSDEAVVTVDENQVITAAAAGRARIDVKVTLNGRTLQDHFYADVDENGKLYFGEYINTVKIVPDKETVSVQDPVALKIEGTLNTGAAADLSQAQTEYIFSENAPAARLEGTDLIYMPSDIANSETFTVQVKVTVDGATAVSEPVEIEALSSSSAADAEVTVSSVRDRNGDYDGNNADSRYLGDKAVDNDISTSWAAKQSDHSPWIQLDFAEEKVFTGITLIERGHEVNEIGEGLLEFFDAKGQCVYSQTVTGLLWEGQPENNITLEQPVKSVSVKFTVDPEEKYYQSGSERGLAEIQIVCDQTIEKKIETFQTVYAETTAGVIPELPETVTAVYTDLTTGEAAVTWDEITEDTVAEPGIVSVYGTVEGTDIKAEARIKVTEASASEADKTLLQKTYDYALTLSTEGVVESAAKFFEEAKAEAKAVLDDPAATQEEVNAAWDKLLEGIWGLGIVQGDKTTLGILIDRAEAMQAEQDRYVQDNWQSLVDALEAAKAVMDDEDALEGDVQTAADDLLNAILAQRYKADKSNLEDLISKAEALDLTKYTEESVSVFKAALAGAKAVMADESLSTDDQASVDAAAAKLDSAINGLQLAAGEGGDGGNTGDGSGNGNTGDNGSTGNGGTSGNGSSDGNSTDGSSVNQAVKTGDNANIALIVIVLVIAAAAVVGVIAARKIRK